MKQIIYSIGWGIIACLQAVVGYAQASEYVVSTWTTREGLPHNAVTALHQTQDGFLWVGTAAGVARFDGVRFQVARHAAAPALESSYVWDVHDAPDGTLWVAASDGAVHLAGDATRTFTIDDGLPSNFVRAVALDANGDVWMGMYGAGVCRWRQSAMQCFGTGSGLPDRFVNTLKVDAQGTVWVGTDTGLSRWTGTGFVAEPSTQVGVQALDLRGDGVFAMGSGTGVQVGAQHLDGLQASVRALQYDRSGTLWVGTGASGVFRHVGGRVESFDPGERSIYSDVRALVEDHEGSLWVGTYGGGLSQLKPSRVKSIGTSQGLPAELVNTVLEARDGALWVGTNEGASRFIDGRITTTLDRADGLDDVRVHALAEGPDGTLWIGTNGAGLFQYDGQRVRPFSAFQGGKVVFGLYIDQQGALWCGTGEGLFVWDGQRAQHLTTADGLADNLVIAVLERSAGEYWIATNNGLTLWRGGRAMSFSTQDGLPSMAIRALHTDRNGRLWVGTRGGLALYDELGRFTAITTVHGLPDPVVYHILDDEAGDLWINTARHGLYRARLDDLDAVVRGEAEQIPTLIVGAADGLRSTDGVGGFQPAGWKAADGTLWFATHQGVVGMHPTHMQPTAAEVPAYIDRVLIDDEPVRMATSDVVLQPADERIEIQYTGISLLDPRRVRFRYRLRGEHEDWRIDAAPTGARRTRSYDHLAPGSYTFEVAAALGEGEWSPDVAELSIRVVPPWWRTPWAIAVGIVLMMGAVYGTFRWRVWQLEQRTLKLETEVAARTAQVAEQAAQLRELDTLKSRFFANLSHEFRTPLTLILGPLRDLLNHTPDPSGRRQLQGMHHQAQRLLRLINQLLDLAKVEAGGLALQRQHLRVADLAERVTSSFDAIAEQDGVRLDVRSEVPEAVVWGDAEKLESILYNLLSNALKFTTAGGKIQVHLEQDSEMLRVHVRDTGTGIAEADLPRVFDRFYQGQEGSKALGSGIGLTLARELARLHEGDLTVDSTLGFGSVFTLHLPRAMASAEPLPPSFLTAGIEAYDNEPALDSESPPSLDAPLVLIVEDNAEVRTYLEHHLARRYRVIVAEDGEAGLDAAARLRPALIVSDLMMPVMDGLELCRRLRANDDLSPIPVILLTARVEETTRLEGLAAGADDYLTKPFSPAELMARAENLIEVRRRLQARYSQTFVVEPTAQEPLPSADAAFLEQVRTTIEAHMADPSFGVEQLAEHMHLSRRQLHRKLRGLSDLSTVGFIRLMRLERAAQLLEQQVGPVAEVAYQVGFHDPSYFTRLFKQTFGVPPSVYRADAPAE
ncbi:MAG: hybrid sensor histidine kinase/response regulator transcription factor [Rhodothermales bacterium]